jgi:TRAP-type C4-dicarboxylate transport system permease small subunit
MGAICLIQATRGAFKGMLWLVGTLDRLLLRFYGWCGYASAALLVLLALLIVASILTRLAGAYVPGLTEYSGYTMAGASFFALAYTFRAGGHIRVGILLNALHGRARWVLQLWCLLVAAFFSGYLAFYLLKMTRVSWILGDRSEGADAILMWIPQSLVAFGALVFALCILHSLARFLAGLDQEEQPAALGVGSGEPRGES